LQNGNFSIFAKNDVAFKRFSASSLFNWILKWAVRQNMGSISTSKFFDVIALSRHQRQEDERMTLLVGEYAHAQGAGTIMPTSSAVFYLDFKDLNADVLQAVNPDLVMSPVIATTFDCLELAKFLEQTGFCGQYRVMLEDIPRPDIICREIRQLHPKVDFDVVQAKPSTAKGLNYSGLKH
jgi:hypothetical protein